ncbi:MAG: hypothetical protein NC048_03740 [Bacteroides sp.]|nr:hypothetical protein [Ruminococcus flavefaciens]MCM1554587.1 hypothetical protein [Bacteroides sp.]
MLSFKKTARICAGLSVVLFAVAALCSCSSNRGTVAVSRTPDFCNSAENRTVPKVEKKATVHPGKDTPIGGDFKERRR